MAEERNLRKVRQGIVVSDKMDKTVVVAVERKVPTNVASVTPSALSKPARCPVTSVGESRKSLPVRINNIVL